MTTYFDRTAAAAWAKLTSNEPVGRIRATVRAGREAMRLQLLDWLPADLSGYRVLDAGCGPGVLSAELARRGARVVAVDVSPTLIGLAGQRLPAELSGKVEFRAGDMLDPAHGEFDIVVAMDSMIHYERRDIVRMLAEFAGRTRHAIVTTFAPRTPALAVMHFAGRLIPHREHRAPAIQPVAERSLVGAIGASAALAGWRVAASERISTGFYTSQGLCLEHACGD
ncbi:MAG: magnesium protoporphyrin IX methyltransferase [Pseudomonadota bacterium]